MAVSRAGGSEARPRWSVLYPEEGLAVVVTMHKVFGNFEIVGLQINPLDGTELGFPEYPPTIVSSELLRRLPLSKIRAACLADLAGDPESTFLEAVRETPKRGQSPVPIETIKRAASEYQMALKRLENPIKRLEVEMGIKTSTARKYVNRAREKGLLAYPAEPGTAGASSPTSPITGRGVRNPNKESQP